MPPWCLPHDTQRTNFHCTATMLAARASSTAFSRNVWPRTSLSVVAGRVAPRAFSAKPPDKPVPTPEEEAERQAAQIRALDTVLEADKHAGEGEAVISSRYLLVVAWCSPASGINAVFAC